MVIEASAPSNIALIKYMGKREVQSNQPTNSSLSWTLEDLRTFVRVSHQKDFPLDEWAPLKGPQFSDLQLSEKSRSRYLAHFQFLKSQFGIHENFLIESANNFPSDCGLASSASSFAALTLGAVAAFEQMRPVIPRISMSEKAELSRKGSGSSCRSFFGPWALWSQNEVRALQFPLGSLLHQVIVVESEKKEVSSSEAHRRVLSSALFEGRPQRAELRLESLSRAFADRNWKGAFAITWAEFWDMHALFETSDPSFGYLLPESIRVLRWIENLWKAQGDGPLVTMDAGANVHLLYRDDQKNLGLQIRDEFKSKHLVFQSKEFR